VQETRRAGGHGAGFVARLRERGHEDHGHGQAARAQRLAQLESVHLRHLYVGYHAGNRTEGGRLQQFLAAAVKRHGKVERAHEPSQGVSDRLVVIDDGDHRGGSHTGFLE